MLVALLLTSLFIFSCVGDKNTKSPQVIRMPKEKQGPGDVWIEPSELTVAAGSTFTNEIHMNSGNQLVAAYGFIIFYDAKMISVDVEIGNSGTTEGPDGFVHAVNPNNSGELVVSGFDVSGKGGPGEDLNMVTAHWIAEKKGESTMHIEIKNLVDEEYADVGKPAGYAAKIVIN